MIEAKPFKVSGRSGLRFMDAAGQGCSIHECGRGLAIRMNDCSGRILLTEEMAIWLVHVILTYAETGKVQ